MKNKKVKILLQTLVILVFLLGINSKVKAASASISASSTNVKVGESVKITILVNGASWNLNLSGAITGAYADVTDDAENGNKTYTTTFTPTSEGKHTIFLTGNASDSNFTPNNINTSVTINVSKSAQNNSSTQTNNKPQSNTKSNDATLRELGIKPNDFKGFNRNKLSYNVAVPYETESVEVYAKKGHDKQTISGTGTKKLSVGSNKVDVVVTAEDGKTKKTYTINITRKEKADSNNNTIDEEEPEEDELGNIGFGLSELTIKGVDLEPQFQTDVYEYRIELKEDLDKLDLSTLATEIGTEIEIMGNENLQEGENVITIIVKGEDEDKNATYQIIVNKTIKKAEAENKDNNMKKILIIGGTIVAGVVILIILIIIIRKRRLEKIEEEDEEFSQYNNININDIYKESIQNTFDEEDGEYERKRKSPKGKRYK